MYGTQPVMDPYTGLEVSETVPISQAVRLDTFVRLALSPLSRFVLSRSLYILILGTPSPLSSSCIHIQAAAQRGACAGWLRAGHCFRLCTEQDFQQLPQQTVGTFRDSSSKHSYMQTERRSKGMLSDIPVCLAPQGNTDLRLTPIAGGPHRTTCTHARVCKCRSQRWRGGS
jgi:hypothetical protein